MSDSKTTTLALCQVGLFLAEDGELCLKTEYGNIEGRIDAYIVSTGEFFWGSHPQTIESQRKQMVRAVNWGDNWLSGYRAGLERGAEIAKASRVEAETLIRDELAEAVIRGMVAERGSLPMGLRQAGQLKKDEAK